jgi:hypothetical protein
MDKKATPEGAKAILEGVKEEVDKKLAKVDVSVRCSVSEDCVSYVFDYPDNRHKVHLFIIYICGNSIYVSTGHIDALVEICDPECFKKVGIEAVKMMKKFIEYENKEMQDVIDWRLRIMSSL